MVHTVCLDKTTITTEINLVIDTKAELVEDYEN